MTDLEPFLTFDVRNEIVAHMAEENPRESCGAITLSSGKYEYVRAENVHVDPVKSFAFDKAFNRKVQTNKSVVAYVHSHPRGPAVPSKRDMEIQKLVGKPSVIVTLDENTGIVDLFSFGNHLLDLPLDDRPFRYGVTDCYEAIRSWRWQNDGVRMDQFARHNGWWHPDTEGEFQPDDLDMYMQNYTSQGFVLFEPNLSDPSSPSHPAIGDLLLMKIGATVGDVVNHAGIYVGNNLVYHHRQGKKSGSTPIGYLPQGTVRAWARIGGVK